MNKTPILDQLRIYSETLVEDLPNIATDIVDAPAPLVPRPPRRTRGLAVAASAAALTLIVVGGLAWLLPISDEVGEPTATTIPAEITETTILTEDPVTPTTVASTDTTLALEPVPPPGEGPQLGFVPVELPGEGLRGGVWFQGALYAISGDGLFRSSDGFTWELLSGPPGIANLESDFQGLEAGGGLLVLVRSDEVDGNSGCGLPGDAIVVHTSSNGVDWKTSRVELPIPDSIPDSLTPFACFGDTGMGGFAVGPQGIMIAGGVRGDIRWHSIFEAELGLGLDPETLEMSIGNIMEVTTADGEIYEIDLEAAGYLDDIESFESSFTGTGYAFFSPDGQTWSQLDASGPLDGGQIADVVATSDGFAATSVSYESQFAPQFLWETTDGTTWIQKSSLSLISRSRLDVWDGRLVSATRDGVWTIEDTPQGLIVSDGTSGLGVIEIGDFGLVGMHSEMGGGGTEVLFSENGATWNRWTPPEFGPEGNVYVVGIGDEFVVLRLITETGASDWVGTLP